LNKNLKILLFIFGSWLISYLLEFAFFGWHVLIFGKEAIAYVILIQYPIVGVILSWYVAAFSMWRLYIKGELKELEGID